MACSVLVIDQNSFVSKLQFAVHEVGVPSSCVLVYACCLMGCPFSDESIRDEKKVATFGLPAQQTSHTVVDTHKDIEKMAGASFLKFTTTN